MYTTIGGSLTPTTPVCSDMWADVTLNVMTDVPSMVEDVEERESTQLTQDIERRSISTVVPQLEKFQRQVLRLYWTDLIKKGYLVGTLYQEKIVEQMLWQQQDISLVL